MTSTLRSHAGHTAPRVPSPMVSPATLTPAPTVPSAPRAAHATQDQALSALLETIQHASPTALAYVSTWQPVRENPALACALLHCVGDLRLQDGEIVGAHLVRWSYPLAILLTTMPTARRLVAANGQTLLAFAASRYPDVANLAQHVPA